VALSVIYSYSISSDGLLTAEYPTGLPAQAAGPFGSVFDPKNPADLFVSNAHAGTAAGSVSAFAVGADGTLTSIGTSPFADTQTAPCWVAITPNGKYLFAVNAGTPSVSSYAVNSDGSLSLIGSFPFSEGATFHPLDDVVSGDDLYVKGATAIAGFQIIDGGFLSQLSTSPTALPTGATASGLAAF
jgi:hypothetical protein